MNDWYTLADDGKTPIKTSDMDNHLTTQQLKVGNDFIGDIHISTIFIRMDHRWDDDPDPRPLLWQTMVFGGPLARELERYRTYDEAVSGHDHMVRRVKESIAVEVQQ